MNNILTQKHFDFILALCRKYSKNTNPKDLSQHIILELLEQDQTKLKKLIDSGEFGKWIGSYVKNQLKLGGSTYNRLEKGCYGSDNWLKVCSLSNWSDFNNHSDGKEFDDYDREIYLYGDFTTPSEYMNKRIDYSRLERERLKEVIDKANLNEIERLIIDYYITYNGNYTTMGDRLGIDRVTVTIKVKEIIEKCKKLR